MSAQSQDLAARKALLTAQADLARIQLALAWHDMRSSIFPSPDTPLFSGTHKAAAFIVGIVTPLLGRRRITRVLRYASIAIAIFRAVRSLRG